MQYLRNVVTLRRPHSQPASADIIALSGLASAGQLATWPTPSQPAWLAVSWLLAMTNICACGQLASSINIICASQYCVASYIMCEMTGQPHRWPSAIVALWPCISWPACVSASAINGQWLCSCNGHRQPAGHCSIVTQLWPFSFYYYQYIVCIV